jgi:hypothetical protein
MDFVILTLDWHNILCLLSQTIQIQKLDAFKHYVYNISQLNG